MRTLINTVAILAVVSLGTACTSGGFNDNPQLDELEDALKKAPGVESISVNGTLIERNAQSIREVEAHIGDVLTLEAKFTSGESAELVELEFFRQYYGRVFAQEAPHPVDSLTDGFYDLSGAQAEFSYDYTVPEVDDDGFHFEEGNIITIQYRVKNTLDNYAFKSLVIEILAEEED